MERLRLPSMMDVRQQRRTVKELLDALEYIPPGLDRMASPSGYQTTAKQYKQVGDALKLINEYMETYHSDDEMEGESTNPLDQPAPQIESGRPLPAPPSYFDAEGRRKWQGLLDDYTRARRQQDALPRNRTTGPEAQPGDPSADRNPAQTQPDSSTGYYTNESGSFYHLNPGDRYYGT